MLKFFTTHGLATILFLIFAFVCLTACTGEAPVQQVKWTASERCLLLFGKDCGCVETPTEDWMQVFKC